MSELSQLKGTFSYDEYKLILEALKTKKTTFEDALKGDFTILRHDVEFNIDRAKKIGVIDNEYGIKSTFFFQVISSAYNPFSVKNKAKILSLIKMGHTVGLHFYISHVPVNNFEKLEHEFNLQKKIFEAGLELPCKIFSFHRPAPSSWVLEIRKDYLFGALNAYGPSFFEYLPDPKNIKYIADSNHRWKYGHPLDYLEFSKMQILVHPDEWSSKKDITELQFLKSLVDDSRKDFITTVDEELGSFAPYRDKIK